MKRINIFNECVLTEGLRGMVLFRKLQDQETDIIVKDD